MKEKWEWVIGFVIGLITLFTVLLRSRQQKEVLDAANKAHEKENKINEKSRNDLVEGLTNISKDKDEKVKEINHESSEAEKNLENEKEKFIEDATNSDDLARRIADHLDADLVGVDDE